MYYIDVLDYILHWKRWPMQCSSVQLEAARRCASPFCALIVTPCQVWSRSTYQLPSL